MRPNGNTRTHPCGRSRSSRSVPNVFAGALPTSSSAPVPEMARCRVFSECSGPCCVPDRGRGWPRLLVSADSPTSDSLQPCGQPKQQFPAALESGHEVQESNRRESPTGPPKSNDRDDHMKKKSEDVGHGKTLENLPSSQL